VHKKTLKGGSLSKTVVLKTNDDLIVRKYISTDTNREYGLVRWQSQLRKLQILGHFLPDNTVKVSKAGIKDNSFYFDIPYYENALNGYQYILSAKNSIKLSNNLIKLISTLSQINFGEVKGSLSVYLKEEVAEKLAFAFKELKKNSSLFSKPEKIEECILDGIKKCEFFISKYSNIPVKESLTHGNLTLENFLIEDSEIMMIDPYSETYCESVYGDISQIMQSTLSGYEYITEKNLFNDPSKESFPFKLIPKELKSFGEEIINRLKSINLYEDEIVGLMYSSQFIRMFPFKIIVSPDQAYFFLMHGVDLLNKVYGSRRI